MKISKEIIIPIVFFTVLAVGMFIVKPKASKVRYNEWSKYKDSIALDSIKIDSVKVDTIK